MQTIMEGNIKWKSLELLLPTKVVNEKQYPITVGSVQVNGTIRDLREAGVIIRITSLFNFSCLACEEVRCTLGNDHGLL